MLRAAAADTLVLAGKGSQRLDCRCEIPPFERGEAARQRRQVGAGGIAPGSGECLDLPIARLERRIVTHHGMRQDDVQVGEPTGRPRQFLARIIVHDAPGGFVARMVGEFGPPQKCARIRHLLLRPAAMAAEFDGVAVKLLCLLQMAECDFDQRQMPAQMTVEEAIARILGEPRQQKGPRGIGFAAFVADMGKPMRPMRVLRVQRH